MKGKLKIGLLISDEFVPQWEYDLVYKVLNSEYAGIELLIVSEPENIQHDKSRPMGAENHARATTPIISHERAHCHVRWFLVARLLHVLENRAPNPGWYEGVHEPPAGAPIHRRRNAPET